MTTIWYHTSSSFFTLFFFLKNAPPSSNSSSIGRNARIARVAITALLFTAYYFCEYVKKNPLLPSALTNSKHDKNYPTTRVAPPVAVLHNNRISISFRNVAAADSGYYTRFALPRNKYGCGKTARNIAEIF